MFHNLKGVSNEMKKVAWLSKKQVASQFLAVHAFSAVIILFFAGIDYIFNTVKSLTGF